MQASIKPEFSPNRLASLDFMRGLIMFLLALEAAGLYNVLEDVTKENWLSGLITQFHHHPWNGLRFWDLIQPGFMFIAGTAMAYSIEGMKSKSLDYLQRTSKILKRCGWLFFWGVLIYAVISLAVVIAIFWRVRRSAALLLLPYLAWVMFASVLNYQFIAENPGGGENGDEGAIERIEF